MIDFSPGPELDAMCARVHAFMDEHVYRIEHLARPFEGLPPEILNPLRERAKAEGLWSPHLPREEGGMGIGAVGLALFCEIAGRSPVGPWIFNAAAPDTGNGELLHLYGSPEQKEKYLKPLAAGELRSCFAMTEPEVAGSDPTLLRCRAVRDGNDWVINGHKWFITGARGSAFAIIMAVTDPDAPPHNRATMFISETEAPGFRILRHIPIMGGEITPGGDCEILFENLRVPDHNRLGAVGDGFKLAQARLGPGRIQHCMRWLGVAHRAFDMMCKYATERFAFGSVLAQKQTVQSWIADSAAEIQAARWMTLHAAWKMDNGLDARTDISLIKFYGAKVLNDVVDRAIQVHGALGYSGDTPLEGFYRAARAARIYDGPDEVHRISVARRILRNYKPASAAAPSS